MNPLQSNHLRVVYVAGMHDGQTAEVDRDTREVTFGTHRNPNFAILDRYTRTTECDARGRVIFQYAGHNTRREHVNTAGIAAALHSIMLRAGLHQPRRVVDL